MWPQFLQGAGMALLFVPLTTVAMAEIERERLGYATSLFNLMRNIGGSVGIAITSTILQRQRQITATQLGEHVTIYDPTTQSMLEQIRAGLMAAGNDVVILGDTPAGLLTLESGGGQDILRLENRADLADLPLLVGDWTIEPPTDGHHFVITGPYQGAPMALDGLNFGIDASGYALTLAEREALFADGVSQIIQPGGHTFLAADQAIAAGPAAQVNTTPGGGLTQIARLGDGYVVVWSAYTNNPSSTIFAQRYDADGAKIGGEISWAGVANVETSVIGLDNGFVVSWTSVSGASGGKVFSQQFDLAGAKAADMEHIQGLSLKPLAKKGNKRGWRTSFMCEYFSENAMPWLIGMSYKAIRTTRHKYIHWTQKSLDGVECDELYDLKADPYEMKNLLGKRGTGPLVARLRKQLAQLVAHSVGL